MSTDPWNMAQSVAAIAAAGFTAPMIYYAAKQLRTAADAYRIAAEQAAIAAKSASATALGGMAAASRELQWKVLEDKSLHPILLPHISAVGLSDDSKREIVRGMLISHYAFVFAFKELGQIPESTWAAFKVDMMEFFSQEANKKRWQDVKSLYGRDFQRFVDNELLLRPA